jgi:hypothetical protein
MLVFSAILSFVLVALTYSMFRQGGTQRQVAILPVVGVGVVGLGCLLPTLVLHAVLVVPGLGLWTWRQWPAKTLAVYMTLAGAGSYSLFMFPVVDQIAELQRLQNEYRFESMENRVRVPRHQAAAKLSQETEEQLSRLEQSVASDSNGFRAVMLDRLHQESVRSFIASEGFGSSRRIRPTSSTLKADLDHDGTPIPQPGSMSSSIYMEDDLREPIDVKPEPLRDMHLASVINFANARGFGLVISRQKVAGFQSHQFSAVPRATEWRVQTIELVGLLMHQDPVIYISSDLPRMEELRNAPTRSLSVFEAAGIERLRQGDDLYIRKTPETLRMLGAVRSVEQCIKCHGGERGDLLGAFSYRLQRVL